MRSPFGDDSVRSHGVGVLFTEFVEVIYHKYAIQHCHTLLDDGETTVGTKIDITHDKASSMGTTVSAVAKLEEVDGRRLVFSVSAKDNDGNVIGKGTIERFVVLADKFMKKVNG